MNVKPHSKCSWNDEDHKDGDEEDDDFSSHPLSLQFWALSEWAWIKWLIEVVEVEQHVRWGLSNLKILDIWGKDGIEEEDDRESVLVTETVTRYFSVFCAWVFTPINHSQFWKDVILCVSMCVWAHVWAYVCVCVCVLQKNSFWGSCSIILHIWSCPGWLTRDKEWQVLSYFLMTIKMKPFWKVSSHVARDVLWLPAVFFLQDLRWLSIPEYQSSDD